MQSYININTRILKIKWQYFYHYHLTLKVEQIKNFTKLFQQDWSYLKFHCYSLHFQYFPNTFNCKVAEKKILNILVLSSKYHTHNYFNLKNQSIIYIMKSFLLIWIFSFISSVVFRDIITKYIVVHFYLLEVNIKYFVDLCFWNKM